MATTADTFGDGEIEQLNRESRKLEAEARKLLAEAGKLSAEQIKLIAEEQKISAEERKLTRDTMLSPWLLAVHGLLAGAALMGAGVALAKLLLAH